MEYEDTRHNIGFRVVDELASASKASFELSRHAFVTEIKHRGRKVHLIKPTTYMNLSGKAVNYWLKELKIPLQNMLVIMDDIALPFGSVRLRPKGSSAGHNGLNDIESYLGTAYPRLRFGVGADYHKGQQADYVLSPFKRSEEEELDKHIAKSCEMALSFVYKGIGRTMTEFND